MKTVKTTNTDLVQGVMKVLDDAGRLDLSVPEIIKPVEKKFASTNNARDEICPTCSGDGYVRLFANCSPFKCGACHGSGKLSPVA